MKELNPCSREVSILSENQLRNKYGEPTPKKCMDNYRSWHESKMSLAASKTLRNSKFSHPQLGSNIWFLPTWLLAIPPSLGDGSLCHSRWPRCLPGSDASGLRVGLAGQENLNVESLSSHSLEFRLLLTDLSSSLSWAGAEADFPIHPSPPCRHLGSLFAGEKPVILVYSFQIVQTILWTPVPVDLVLSVGDPAHLVLEENFTNQSSLPIRKLPATQWSPRCWRIHTCQKVPTLAPWGRLALREPFLTALQLLLYKMKYASTTKQLTFLRILSTSC